MTGQAVTDLALSKGARSYEDQTLGDYIVSDLVGEAELAFFLRSYSPQTAPEDFARKQRLVRRDSDEVTVAGAVLYADNPSTVVPTVAPSRWPATKRRKR